MLRIVIIYILGYIVSEKNLKAFERVFSIFKEKINWAKI